MQHLEGSSTPVLDIGHTVVKEAFHYHCYNWVFKNQNCEFSSTSNGRLIKIRLQAATCSQYN